MKTKQPDVNQIVEWLEHEAEVARWILKAVVPSRRDVNLDYFRLKAAYLEQAAAIIRQNR